VMTPRLAQKVDRQSWRVSRMDANLFAVRSCRPSSQFAKNRRREVSPSFASASGRVLSDSFRLAEDREADYREDA
jgi:hypothetical protein